VSGCNSFLVKNFNQPREAAPHFIAHKLKLRLSSELIRRNSFSQVEATELAKRACLELCIATFGQFTLFSYD
jgi:hypothetical protein